MSRKADRARFEALTAKNHAATKATANEAHRIFHQGQQVKSIRRGARISFRANELSLDAA